MHMSLAPGLIAPMAEVRVLYSGWTHNLEKRLAAHNAGKGAKATRGRVWQILHFEVFKTRGAAMSREAELKRL